MTVLEIRRPMDFHAHLRSGALMHAVAKCHRQFGLVLAMPNTDPPITTTSQGVAYLEELRAALPAHVEPKLACYLTDTTDVDDLLQGWREGVFLSAKWYPRGATTGSHAGVSSAEAIGHVLSRMALAGMPLCIHAEVPRRDVDVFDRERVFLETVIKPIRRRYALRMVIEHITTARMADYVAATEGVFATITPHHLLWNRNALFDGGLQPDAYCLPVLKTEADRDALVLVATSDDPSFFLGTDSAPHEERAKYQACGCAGIFNSLTALATCAEIFEGQGALDRLERFVSLNGAAFYGLSPCEDTIILEKVPMVAPQTIKSGAGGLIRVFRGGETLPWSVRGGWV